MNYNNIPNGYVLVTKKTEEIAKKYNLDKNIKNALYRDFLKLAKEEGRKYSNNPECRIWLLNEKLITEEFVLKILKKIDPNFGEPTLLDILEEENNYKRIINSIKDVINLDIDSNKRLEIIRCLINNI